MLREDEVLDYVLTLSTGFGVGLGVGFGAGLGTGCMDFRVALRTI